MKKKKLKHIRKANSEPIVEECKAFLPFHPDQPDTTYYQCLKPAIEAIWISHSNHWEYFCKEHANNAVHNLTNNPHNIGIEKHKVWG